MIERSPYLVAPYSALAAVYERAGLAEDARQLAPRLVEYAHTLEWAGRRMLDLGCGTGASSRALAALGYRVVGIDSSAPMLEQAAARNRAVEASGLDLVHELPDYHLMDLRELESPIGPVDLALALGGVLNALTSLRDIERVFGGVCTALDTGKLFMFDLRTIRGVAQDAAQTPSALFDDAADLTVMRQSLFNFETLSATHTYLIFERQAAGWQRSDEAHLERGYPTQAISALLRRQGFEMVALLDTALQPFDPQRDPHGRVVFVARKA